MLQALIHAHQRDADASRTALAAADRIDSGTVHADLRATVADLLLHPGKPPIHQAGKPPTSEGPGDEEKLTAKGCLLAIVALVGLFAVQRVGGWLMELGGDRVASFFGIGGPRVDGHSILGLAAVGAVTSLLWWGVGAVRGKHPTWEERRRRRARARSFADELDDDNVRLRAATVAALLPFSMVFALGPTVFVGMNPLGGWLIAGCTLVASCAAVWSVCHGVGVRMVTRAVRLSRLLVVHAVAAYVSVGAFAGALIAGVSEEELNRTGTYWIPAALLDLLVTGGYVIARRQRLKEAGRLRIWREDG
ncbi:hypothetical protein [Sphaerisporangium sp. NPDC051011]|uniref:hypothetical protein n=1 Tax=Sphaerisporangium sp. NPDC051011 TaxID=3155792 RepID=UPI0034085D80